MKLENMVLKNCLWFSTGNIKKYIHIRLNFFLKFQTILKMFILKIHPIPVVSFFSSEFIKKAQKKHDAISK